MKKLWGLLILFLALAAFSTAGLARDLNFLSGIIDAKTSDRIHLREGPSSKSKSLGLYFSGTPVLCDPNDVDKEYAWVHVGAESGYMKTEFLYFGIGFPSTIPMHPTAYVNNRNGTFANVRSGPSSDMAILATPRNGTPMTLLGETSSKWYYVIVGDQYGYIMTSLVTQDAYMLSATPAPQVPSPTAPAPAYFATPIVAGATPPPTVQGTISPDTYKQILFGSGSFFDATSQSYMTLSQYAASVADAPVSFSHYTVVDMDYDRIPEVVVRIAVNGNEFGSLVLHGENGVIYGHTFGLRSMSNLKYDDGTFSFSSSAAEFGYGSVRFEKDKSFIVKYAHSEQATDAAGNSTVAYFLDDRPATTSEFETVMARQDQKSDASWYEWSSEALVAVLSTYR